MLKGKPEQSNRGSTYAISSHQCGEGVAGTDPPWIGSGSLGGFELQQPGSLRPRDATPWLRAACGEHLAIEVFLAVRNRRYAFAARLCNAPSRAYGCGLCRRSPDPRGPEEIRCTSLRSIGDA